jgi:hypothetical protein
MKIKISLLSLLILSGPYVAAGQLPPRWTTSEEPLVSIGAIDDDEAYLFAYVVACVSDVDGRIFVADTRQFRVSVFSESGVFIREFGSEGTGPGEFKALSSMRVVGDQVRILDNGLSRIVVFDTTGAHLSTTQMEAGDDSHPRPAFFHGDSVFAFAGGSHGFDDAGGVFADTLAFYMYDSLGKHLGPIGQVPDSPRLGFEFRGTVSFDYLPFGTSPSMHGNGREVVFGQGTQKSIHVVRADGAVQQIPVPLPTETITSEMKQRFSSNLMRDVRPENEARLKRYLELAEFPDTLPRFDRLRIDTEGLIWVRPYTLSWNPASDWVVLDDRGQIVATATLPASFSPEEIQFDSILGITRDNDGYQFVERYALRR